MTDPVAGARWLAREATRIGDLPIRAEQRAEALLAALRRVVPFEAGRVTLLDPETREHVLLAADGYDERTRRYLATPELDRQVELLGLRRERRAMCPQDNPIPQAELPLWADYFYPAGLRGGIGTGLFTPDGRYLGMLGLTTASERRPAAASLALVDALMPSIAGAVDPLRSIVALARIVAGAEAGVVLTRTGAVEPLPGLPGDPLLGPGSGALAVAAGHLAEGASSATFLWPAPTAPTSTGPTPAGPAVAAPELAVRRVTVLSCAAQPMRYLTGLVTLSAPGDLVGLGLRELTLLGLLVRDWPDRRIADTLAVSRTELAASIEMIFARLRVTDRLAAACLAVARGLYVPHHPH